MSGVEVADATSYDVAHVAEHMRMADMVEVWDSSNKSPLDALQSSVDCSLITRAVRYSGVPVAIFGLSVHNERVGSPWLLATDKSLTQPAQFLRIGYPVVASFLDETPLLVNFVHSQNEASKRWLRKLGFIIEAPARYGVENEMFHRFSMEKTDV